MTNDWVKLEDFVEHQIRIALAELDDFIAEHTGAEREAMQRQRPKVAAQIAGIIRMHYAQKADQ